MLRNEISPNLQLVKIEKSSYGRECKRGKYFLL